jgi:cytochrome P450
VILKAVVQLLRKQIDGHVNDPETLKALPHKTTIYHILLDPSSHKSRGPASAKSLYEESQALMFGGGDTTANVIMIGTFYLLKRPDLVKKLKDELKEYWPELGPGKEPKLSVLEEMPFLVSPPLDQSGF